MYGLSGHFRLAAFGLAAIILIVGSVLLDEEDGMLAKMAADGSSEAEPVAAMAPRPAPQGAAQPQSQPAGDAETGFSDDDDLIDDASGFDTDGFETNPMIDPDPERADDLGETAVLQDSAPDPGPPLAGSEDRTMVSGNDREADI
ncbi:MAG: hypothetical protein R3E18_07225 [Sphingomonadaceae bacterium]|nr:hypothetical protein [Sphingomonadaceae bacterium]